MSFLCGGCINDEEEKKTTVNLVQEEVKEAKLKVETMTEIQTVKNDFPSDLFQNAMARFPQSLKSMLTEDQVKSIGSKAKQWSLHAKQFRDGVATQSGGKKSFVNNPIYLVAYSNKSMYYGQILKDGNDFDSLEGIGVMLEIMEDGNVLVSAGLFKKTRKPSGDSFIAWPNGDYFFGQANFGKKLAGEFKNNTEKRIYFGGFDPLDRLIGEGKLEYVDDSGRKYEGDFREGKPHGHGKFTWKEGNTYTGDFVNGKQHGFGQLYIKEKSKVYETHWQNGVLQD